MVAVAVAGALVLGTALLVEPIAEGAWLSVIAADRLHWQSLLLPMLALAGLVLYTLVSFLTPARPFGVRGRAGTQTPRPPFWGVGGGRGIHARPRPCRAGMAARTAARRAGHHAGPS